MNFFGVQVNDSLERSLRLALEAGKLPHAVLFEGGSAQDRMTLAKHLAAALVCVSQGEKPCTQCIHCRKALGGTHPDVETCTADEKSKIFRVDTVRKIIENSLLLPNEAEKKVFIIDNIHTMNDSAQNAFLKVLEEPPKHVSFIALCPDKSSLLPTVLSRVTVFRLGESVDGEENEKALHAAVEVARAVTGTNELDIVVAAAVFEKEKDLIGAALPIIEDIFAAALRIKCGADTAQEKYEGVDTLLSSRLTQARLVSLIEAVGELMKSRQANTNKNLLITRLCMLLRK